MPLPGPRPAVTRLPAEARTEIDRMLEAGATYSAIAERMSALGVPVGRTAIGSYGKRFHRAREKAEDSQRTLKAFLGDIQGGDEAAAMRAVMRIGQAVGVRALMATFAGDEVGAREFLSFARAIAAMAGAEAQLAAAPPPRRADGGPGGAARAPAAPMPEPDWDALRARIRREVYGCID